MPDGCPSVAARDNGECGEELNTSCMAGDTMVKTGTSSGEANLKEVRDLQVGDTVEGLDEDMMPAMCSVVAIGHFGSK